MPAPKSPESGARHTARKVGDRVRVGAGWNAYNKLATVSDASGNGTTDLIAIDASGQGYRYDGQGAYGGKFKPRASLGGGWNIYNELF
ncbi:hypothetical protein ACQEVM_35610 [Streptomyces sp. CA-243310]|uniref:hypothetical protein n=1 Tax=Streptomyces sp. CA-243310 TaxID=3240056 RepID=UPI003D8CF529